MKKKIATTFVLVVLIAGTVAGVSMWLADVEVNINYEKPTSEENVTVQLSGNETKDYNWYEVEIGKTNELGVNFNENEPWTMYHQYVNITAENNITVKIESPKDVDSDLFGFKVIKGIVEPGDECNEDTQWGSTNFTSEGSGVYTVIYQLKPTVNLPDEINEPVVWEFRSE